MRKRFRWPDRRRRAQFLQGNCCTCGRKEEAMGKSGMKPGFGNSGRKPDAELGQALLTLVGAGLAGGIALIGGAIKLGEKILDLQVKAYEKIEAERESQKQAAREIAESEMEFASEEKDESLQPEADE